MGEFIRDKRTDKKGRKLPDGFSQRSDGRYQARFTFEGKRYCFYDTNLSELKKKVTQKQADLQNDRFVEIEKITLNAWYEKWLDIYKTNKIKPVTLANYKKYWKWYVSDTLGQMQISKVKRVNIVKLYNDYLNGVKSLSYGTVQYINNLLYSCLEQAFQNDMILKNPCTSVLKELKKEQSQPKNALKKQEQQLFFDYLKQNKFFKVYEPLFAVMFGTGMRVGEVLSLTWKDIDFKSNSISVNKTIHYAKTGERQEFSITTPKTKNSYRSIPMLDEVRTALKQQQSYQMMLGIKWGHEVSGYKGFVFTTTKGTTFIPDVINRIIKDICTGYNKGD